MKKIVSLIVLLILCVGNISVIAESDNEPKDTVLERITESSVILQAGLDEAIVYGKKIKLEKTLDVEKNTTKLSHDFLEQYFGQNVDSLEGLTNKNVYENNGLYIISEKEINKTQIDQYYYKLCMLFGVFVDTQSKRGNGTIAKPFSNIEDAITLIKEIEKNSGFLEGEYPVYLRQGNYQICKTYKFDDISIPEGTNVVFRPYKNEKVILSGGVNFYGKDFETITENDILEKLPNDSKGKVYRINLSSYGLSDFGDKVLDTSANPSEMNLIYNGQTMNVARWPNQGTVKTGKMLVVNGSDGTPGFEFVFDNPRIAKWVSAKNPWIWGTFEWEWFAESLQVKNIDLSKNSIRTVNNHRFTPAENRNWYIYNLLEELDEAGEYYFDKSTGYLYFYPGIDDVKNGTFREAQLCLSTLNENMIELNKCKNIEFRNVIFENAGSNMIVMNDCDNVIVSGCVIRNCGNTAIDAENVSNVKIVGCDIYNIGGKGVFLTGGNRNDFTPGNNEILNCRIYKFGQTVRTYASGISLQGCGNRAAHNELFDFPHTAISNSYSNNNIFEYNEIHDGLTDGANDAGVVYVSVDPTAFGNILRNNYFHDIYAGIGTIYLDDATAGYTVENNLFYNVSRSVFMHGANYSKVVGNVTLNTNQDSIAVTVMSHDTRWDPKTLTPAAGSTSKSTDYMNCAKRVPFTSEIWKKTYPQVENVISWGIAREPLNNEIHDNVTFSKNGMKTVFVNSNAHYVEEHDNPYYAEEISFDDILNKKNEVISKIPGFDKIGLDSIGIYKDEIRDSMPVIEDFNMSYPYNKQENVEATSVTFKWTDANATRKYRFILALDESFRKIVRDDIVFGTSHTVNGLRYNETRYYWKIEAISNNQLSLEEKVKPASSKYFSFTTKKEETIDYTNAENILYQAENTYKNMIEGGGPGEFFEGAKSEYAQLTEALKTDLKMKNMSQRKLNNILDDFTSKENVVLSKRNQMTIRVNDMFVQEDWSFKQNTASFSKSSFAWVKGSGDDPQVVGYSKRKLENYENFKTNVTFDLAEGTWQGISMRASSPSTVSWNGNSQYMVIVKSDVIEFQKYKNNKYGIYDTYENKWIKSGEKYLIDFEIKNVEGVAAEITFKVNGEPIIQYTDKDDPILNSGYLQFYNASGGKTLKVEAVE